MLTVSSLNEAKIRGLDIYNKGLSEYKGGNFVRAMGYFKDVLEFVPGDVVSLMYIERCKLFVKEPPPSDWDGVFVVGTK